MKRYGSGNRRGVGRPAAQLVPRHGNFRLSRGRCQQPGFLGLAARGRGTRQQNRVVAAATELSGRAHGRQRLGNGVRLAPPRQPTGSLAARRRRQAVSAPARTCYDCHSVFAGIAARTSSLAAAAKGAAGGEADAFPPLANHRQPSSSQQRLAIQRTIQRGAVRNSIPAAFRSVIHWNGCYERFTI